MKVQGWLLKQSVNLHGFLLNAVTCVNKLSLVSLEFSHFIMWLSVTIDTNLDESVCIYI